MGKGCTILLVVIFMALVCNTYAKKRLSPKQLQELPVFKCMQENVPKDPKSSDSCVVQAVPNDKRRTEESRRPKPTNCGINIQIYKSPQSDCDLYGNLTFAYTAMDVDIMKKVEGFGIEVNAGTFLNTKYYTVTLPKNYRQSTGGRFEIGLTNFVIPDSFDVKIRALPNSKGCKVKIDDRNTLIKTDTKCMDPKEYKTRNCQSSYPIPICETPTNKTTDVMETTSPPTTTSSTPVPPHQSTPAKGSRNLLVLGLMIVFVLIICFVGASIIRKRMLKKANMKRAVILASSGDSTSKFTDLANLIASELKLSNEFEEVFFTGWLQVNNLGSNLEQLLDALHRSTVVILFASPYGKTSYEKFLEQGQLATWKDEFILGAHSLFRPSNHTTIQSRIKSKRCTVYVVYQSNDKLNKSDLLHDDFKRHAHRCYDLSIPQNNTALYKKLLRRRKIQSIAADQEPGEDNENTTTKFI